MLLTILLIATLLGISGCRSSAPPVTIGNKPVSVNDVKQPDSDPVPLSPNAKLSWSGFDGSIQKIGDYKGKVLVLDFWATYCGPCLEEIPHLKEVQAKYGTEALSIVGLHVGGPDDRPKVPNFVKNLDITYSLGNPDAELEEQILGGDSRIPQTIVFGKDGNMVKRLVGFDENVKRDLDEAVKAAIGEAGA